MPLVPLLTLALAAVAFAVAVRLAITSRPSAPSGPEERAVTTLRWAALLLSVPITHLVTSHYDELGRNLVIAPISHGLVLLVGAVIAELLVRPRYLPGPRTAALRPRSLRDHLPRTLTRLVAATFAAAVILCTFTVLRAGADDMGREGRSLPWACEGAYHGSRGPFPGSFYVAPYAIGVLVALVVMAIAVVIVLRRPLGGTPDVADRHRTAGVTASIAAFGIVVTIPLGGLAWFAALTLAGIECREPLDLPMLVVAMLSVALSVVTAAVSLSHLFISGPGRRSTDA